MNTSITHLSVMCVGGGGEGVGPICDEGASFCRIQDGVQVLHRSTKFDFFPAAPQSRFSPGSLWCEGVFLK